MTHHPDEREAVCANCGKAKAGHVEVLGVFYCYEFTPELSGENACMQFVAATPPTASAPPDTKLLAAWTPEFYAGHYPPYVNLTMERSPSAVVLTVRQPTVHGAPPGETAQIRLTHEAWTALVALIPDAHTIYRAARELDAIF